MAWYHPFTFSPFKTDIMRKYFVTLWIGLVLVSTAVKADSDEDIREALQTSKHHILISTSDDVPGDETFTYRAWNKPKKADQGEPDLMIDNGTMWEPVSATDITCMKGAKGYDFKLKNIDISLMIYGCPEKGQPSNAIGTLDVSINGKRRSRYWIYGDAP